MITPNITPRGRYEFDRNDIAASFVAKTTPDPAAAVPGAPRGFGTEVMPHIFSVAGRIGSISRTYPWYDEALRDSRQNAASMRRESLIMECLEARQRGTALLRWHVEPQDSKDEAAKDLADKVTAILEETNNFLELRRNLLEALWYGRYMTSHRWGMTWVQGAWRQYIKSWTPRHGDKLVFRFDDGTGVYDPDQVGIRLGGGWGWSHREMDYTGKMREKIEVSTQFGLVYWMDKWEREMVGIHKHIIEDGEFYDPRDLGRVHGVGIRDRIYWTWYGMMECLSNALDFIERNAHGIEIWRYPAGNPQAEAETIKAAENRSNKAVLLVPVQPGDMADLQSVEVVEPGFAGLDALMGIVTEWYAHKIKRYILGQTLSSEAAATGLGSGVADAHLATLADIVRYDAYKLEETITRDIVRSVQLFNFPESSRYKLLFRLDTEAEDMESKLQAWKAAYEMGASLPALDVLSLIGSRMPDEQEEVLSIMDQQAQQAELQAQQMQLQAQLQPDPAPGEPGGRREPSTTSTFGPMDSDGPPPAAGADEVDMARPGEPSKYEKREEDGKLAPDEPEQDFPSEKQRDAGNYRKEHLNWNSLRISIENEKGTKRRPDKPDWPDLPADYGYIRGTEDRDGDHVDVFLGPHLESELVVVIDQVTAGGRFDEHKVMLGFNNAKDALACYKKAYQAGWRVGPHTVMTLEQFKSWLADGDQKKRAATQVSKYKATAKWDEALHPRDPGGEHGGEFTSKGSERGSKQAAGDLVDPQHAKDEGEDPDFDRETRPRFADREKKPSRKERRAEYSPAMRQAYENLQRGEYLPADELKQMLTPEEMELYKDERMHQYFMAVLAMGGLVAGSLALGKVAGMVTARGTAKAAADAFGDQTNSAVQKLFEGMQHGEQARFHMPVNVWSIMGDNPRDGKQLAKWAMGPYLKAVFGRGNVKFQGMDADGNLMWGVRKVGDAVAKAATSAASGATKIAGYSMSQGHDFDATCTKYGTIHWEDAA